MAFHEKLSSAWSAASVATRISRGLKEHLRQSNSKERQGDSLSSRSASRQRKLEKGLLSGADCEFLLERVKNGKYKIRIGQIWEMPKMRGATNILLDLDNCRRFFRKEIIRRLSRCGVQVLRIRSKKSPGGNGMHVFIIIKGTFGRYERIALQSICGSDLEREAQNFRRARLAVPQWKDNWNVLYKK
jgi:hypothetical protein